MEVVGEDMAVRVEMVQVQEEVEEDMEKLQKVEMVGEVEGIMAPVEKEQVPVGEVMAMEENQENLEGLLLVAG